MNEFLTFFKLGLNHVLDLSDYDHMLFLLVLTVAYTFKDWKRVFWLVTVFTIGHTISLILATYGAVSFSENAIRLLIYITIVITALYNIFTAGKTSNKTKIVLLLVAALFFGLIHGLGFASHFKFITSGFESKLLPMLEFALGVEAAQIIIVLVVLVVSFIFQTIFRFNKRDWIMVISAIVLGIAIHIIDMNYI
ncbi:HupE/UreJ family protein [Kordia sp. YSTF-M3]|uniref:HupE/UreJ family protein n=1 Tax=Kordia aestuariivivens TaxID=2759037 RepID=A0ABR7Q6Q7_9FLAO|nr:HupE/UreJ family protein [Kordia aestuariivivens]MBC8754241.1 HupE/UreJ family protein [Kordia aestuariivivens]